MTHVSLKTMRSKNRPLAVRASISGEGIGPGTSIPIFAQADWSQETAIEHVLLWTTGYLSYVGVQEYTLCIDGGEKQQCRLHAKGNYTMRMLYGCGSDGQGTPENPDMPLFLTPLDAIPVEKLQSQIMSFAALWMTMIESKRSAVKVTLEDSNTPDLRIICTVTPLGDFVVQVFRHNTFLVSGIVVNYDPDGSKLKLVEPAMGGVRTDLLPWLLVHWGASRSEVEADPRSKNVSALLEQSIEVHRYCWVAWMSALAAGDIQSRSAAWVTELFLSTVSGKVAPYDWLPSTVSSEPFDGHGPRQTIQVNGTLGMGKNELRYTVPTALVALNKKSRP